MTNILAGIKARVIEEYKTPYPEPVTFLAGEHVALGKRDTEWTGWVWCTSPHQRSAWIPQAFLSEHGEDHLLIRNYTSTELSLSADETVCLLCSESDWFWGQKADGTLGWLPSRCVSIVEDILSPVITPSFLQLLKEHYSLDWLGLHGYAHWLRVRKFGLRLAEVYGVDPLFVEYFAFLHDIERLHDGVDNSHGRRAANYIEMLVQQEVLNLSSHAVESLQYACIYHSDGQTTAPIAVQICWDADRLDLGRIGVMPNPQYLCTAEACKPDLIDWAYHHVQNRIDL